MKPTKPPSAERGRPRDEASTDAILTATLRLLAERGYRKLSLDDVVTAAHVSKATVYRRWESKAQIVAAAIRAALVQANPTIPDTGDARRDVTRVLENTIRTLAKHPFGSAVRALVSEAMFDAELAAAVREVEVQRREILRTVVARAVEKGALAGDVELLVDVLLGAPYFQLFVRQRVPAARLAADVVDLLGGDA